VENVDKPLRERPVTTIPVDPVSGRVGLSHPQQIRLRVLQVPNEVLSAELSESSLADQRIHVAHTPRRKLLHLEVNRITNATAPLPAENLLPDSARSLKRASWAEHKVKSESLLMETSSGSQSR
jgi:hypothetical protein